MNITRAAAFTAVHDEHNDLLRTATVRAFDGHWNVTDERTYTSLGVFPTRALAEQRLLAEGAQ